MTKDNTAAAAVAELDSVLNQIKTAASKKTAAEMHEQGGGDRGKATSLNSSTPDADDGDQQLAEGERVRENLSDVKDQQSLSHETEGAPADSPAYNNAADETGSVDETGADADEGKQNQHPDTQRGTSTSHPARTDNAKIAELLKLAEDYSDDEDYEDGDYDYDENGESKKGGGYDKNGKKKSKKANEGDYENGEGGENGGGENGGGEAPPGNGEGGENGGGGEAPPENGEGGELPPEAPPENGEGGELPPEVGGGEMPPEGGAPMDPSMPQAEPSEEELMAIEQLLGGVPPKMAAAVPDIPDEDDALRKMAAEEPDKLNTYVEKVAQTYPDEIQNGYTFAANLAASLKQAKTASAGGDDAQTQALIKQAFDDAGNVAEMVEGVEEGGAGEMGMEGVEDPTAGGEAPLEDEVALGGDEGADAAGEAEALLAALSQGGAGDDALMKAAKAVGFDETRAKAALAKSREA